MKCWMWCIVWGFVATVGAAQEAVPPVPWTEQITADRPAYWWRFETQDAINPSVPSEGVPLSGRILGKVKQGSEGPRPSQFPTFTAGNSAVEFSGEGGSIRYADPGDNSPLDFAQGDAITIEAWVNVEKLAKDQQMYVIGKGRTKNPGFPADNQNFALRLTGANEQARLSFLFRDATPETDGSRDYHRWDSKQGFPPASGWHHLAVSYVFGDPQSIAGFIDGERMEGLWSYGGPTTEAPVVDNDELWIGSSMGGNPSSSFRGVLDEIVIHRRVIPPERLAGRYVAFVPPSYVTPDPLPQNAVLVEVFHGIPDKFHWKFSVPEPYEKFEWPLFALLELPQVYTAHGVRGDRSNPLLVRMSGMVTWPAGEIRLRLRSRSAANLTIDGQVVASAPFPKQLGDGSDGNGGLYPVPGDDPAALHEVATGDQEVLATFTATGQPQRVQIDYFCGGNKRRPELGEALLAWGPAASQEIEQIVGFGATAPLTNAGWWQLSAELQARLTAFDRERRAAASADWTAYWDRRHAAARQFLEQLPAVSIPVLPSGYTANNPIDHFIARTLAEAQVTAQPLIDDWAFLRRATLDVIGTVPTPAMIQEYFSDPAEQRRELLIDRLLAHPGWADHWVGYWQDVLAENPNVINPTLNNTGPFRWWLHESFSDNKPFDRFATELVLMEGSTHYGGPAGFSLATQNDAPMAAKAHILAQAFLGMEMKCARCHDAPYHDFAQRDLFSLASMLNRKPVSVPATSTIPGDPAALQSLLVKVTLKPGEPVPAEWPFAERFSGHLSNDMLANPEDRREQLAAIMTAPGNQRFNQVIVNRVWRRYLGRGLVEPVDDWETFAPSHPELLNYLEQQFVAGGSDLKSLARLILSSQIYQRQTDSQAGIDERRARLLAGPPPRRMTAEQVVDSLFALSGKPINVEPMNIDVDGMRSYESSLNLGPVSRAWQFTSMSNERDRPSLSLPGAQTVVDVLETFGWRATRPDPLTIRPQETTVLQPAILANGVVAKRVTQLSDDSRFTEIALRDLSIDEFLDELTQAILTRLPTSEERAWFREVLSDGYAERRVPGVVPLVRPKRVTSIGVAWTNHLHPEANERKEALKHELDRGDPPTQRLTASWRERAEDVVWALLNSPEFVFVP